MANLAKLFSAIAQLLWPLLVFVIIVMFRKEVKALLSRLRKGKFAGQEFELDADVKEFERLAERATAKLLPEGPSSETPGVRALSPPASKTDGIQRILDQAKSSPQLGLIALSIELEREVRELAEALGHLQEAKPPTLRRVVEVLVAKKVLPEEIVRTTQLFGQVRNAAVHGSDVDDRSIVAAIDSGIGVLRAIKATPRKTHKVLFCDIPIFSDAQCTQLIAGATAVLLEHVAPDGSTAGTAAFPTTRTDYAPGLIVSWEWNMDRTFGESWYLYPQTKERRYGWSSAAEFNGRPLGAQVASS